MTTIIDSVLSYSLSTLVAGALVLVLAGVFFYLFVILPALTPLNSLPGPEATHLIFGNLKQIMDIKWTEGHFPEPGLTWIKQYGGIVHYRAFLSQRILLTDPEGLKHVYQTNNDNYPRDPVTRRFLSNMTGGDGLLSSEGQIHHGMRKLLMPHFGFGKVKSFVEIFNENVNKLSEQLDPLVQANTTVDMHDYFTKLTLDVIGMSAFGYNFGSLSGGNNKALEAYHMMNNPPSIFYYLGNVLIPGFKHLPFPRLVKMKNAKQILYKVVDDVIESKLKNPATKSSSLDLLDLMLDSESQTDHKISAEEARVHVLTFLLAGHETTSTTLSWVFAMLAQNPEVERKAREECQSVLKACNGVMTWSGLADLKYTTAVIHETLRIFPTIAVLASRISSSDDMLPLENQKPVFIPKGTTIVVNNGVLHRNPKYWTRPSEFLPDRFLENTELFNQDRALRNGRGNTFFYMPFSEGPKNCIGMRFAMAELQVVIATLLSKYSFKLTSDANVNPKLSGVSMKPVNLSMSIHSPMLLRTIQRLHRGPSIVNVHASMRFIFSQSHRHDPYKILNIPRSATAKDIKLAYFREAKKCHPDLNPNDPHATTKFRNITEAYEILSDSTRKANFDSGKEETTHSYSSRHTPPHHEEQVFNSVFDDASVVKDAFKLYVDELHGEFVFARDSASRGEWKNVWQVVKERKGIVFGVVMPIALFIRFPAIIPWIGRGLVLGGEVLIGALAYSPALRQTSTWLWRRIVQVSRDRKAREPVKRTRTHRRRK
ncbi:hypothetical protein THRCLA_02376 [Thraustotheca clavata]|uniref:J domain-containing protein n=1 Tax=Thraustotheca clavata TaxID=74557 RepID=A0A1W0A5M2_9STRA|nr:hypothetical protein THRCLA_02376 [Thraustotheca clavata]